MDRINRRQLLFQAAALGAIPQAVSAATTRLTIRAYMPGGTPCEARLLKTLVLNDPTGRARESVQTNPEPGVVTIELPKEKFQLTMILPVKDFGSVCLWADNAGKMYDPAGGELLLNYEFARSRAAVVRRYMEKARQAGVVFSKQLLDRVERGEAALKRAEGARDLTARLRYSDESLSETMWAGEMAALERARYRIAGQAPRPGFLFGAYPYPYSSPFPNTDKLFRLFTDLFNEATVPFFRRGTTSPYFRPAIEREDGTRDYSLASATAEKLAGAGITLKGHPLMWFGGPSVTESMRKMSFEGVKKSWRNYVLDTIGRFRSRMHTWIVMNEAHDMANDLGYNHEQLLEMTRFAGEITRVADPTAFRIVNAHVPWYGESAPKDRTAHGEKKWSPFDYLADVENARIPYEAIGLQFYEPARDMLDLERQVERFFVFQKPIWITELGICSSSEPYPWRAPSPYVWHGTEWSERIQADWVEQFYTICYSKPEIDAVSWWNFADPALHPHAGFVTPDLRPKEAYFRLRDLIRGWRSA